MLASAVLAVARSTPRFLPRRRMPAVVSHNAFGMELKPAPINPDWIIAGAPEARSAEQSASDDRAAFTAVWDCTAGSFRWYFGWDETVCILEGEVHIVDADGGERRLGAGDVAYFRGGTWATWTVERYVRKVAFMRRTLPRPAGLIYRVGDAARRRLERTGASGMG